MNDFSSEGLPFVLREQQVSIAVNMCLGRTVQHIDVPPMVCESTQTTAAAGPSVFCECGFLTGESLAFIRRTRYPDPPVFLSFHSWLWRMPDYVNIPRA